MRKLKKIFLLNKRLKGKRILVTAGPTFEPIDPVRFIGNYSSGKMGYAIAEACASEAAEVILVSGPVSLRIRNKNIRIIRVMTAREMHENCLSQFQTCHAAILSAAVADFSPEITLSKKLKRTGSVFDLRLVPTVDIAADLGKVKSPGQILVGFALETDNEIENATGKLKKKNFDFIVLNSLNDPGAGFQNDTNKITLIDRNNNIDKFELKSKKEAAVDIVKKLISLMI